MNDLVNPTLVDLWISTLADVKIGSAQSEAGLLELAHAYSQPDRHYHNLEHVQAVLEKIIELIDPDRPSPPLMLAGWFHDVIYDSRAKDNEEQSAHLAHEQLHAWGLADHDIGETERPILLTKSHRAEEKDWPGQVLLDADLAILGSDSESYQRYAEAIRQEYAWVSEVDYRNGRSSVLERFLNRPWIFFTARMRRSHEDRARANLQGELERLRSGTT